MVTGFVLTRTVRDCAAMLDAVAGYAVGDSVPISAPPRPYLDETKPPAERLRIAFTARTWSGLPVDPEIVAGVQSTARMLEQLGHVVVEDTPQFDYDMFLNAQIDLWVAHTATAIDAVAQAVGRQPSTRNLQATTWAVYEAGRRLPATQFLQAEEIYNQLRRKVARFFTEYDVLLTPTSAIVPPLIDAQPLNVAGASVRDLFEHLAPVEAFTALFNATGQPAISLPLHWTAGGLPLGMQFVGRCGDESTLLRLAAQLELALPWHARRPSVHASAQI
jgi:amidase